MKLLLTILILTIPLTTFAQELHYSGEGKVAIPLGEEEPDATTGASPIADVMRADLDNDGIDEFISHTQKYELNHPIEAIITLSKADSTTIGSFSMLELLEKVEIIDLNKDGFKQIAAWSHSGMHYTNMAIYGYKDGELYQIFEEGSGCGIETAFNVIPPIIKVGRPNWEQEGWSYADEPLWQTYIWNGKGFVESKGEAEGYQTKQDILKAYGEPF